LHFVHDSKIYGTSTEFTDVTADRINDGLLNHVVNTVQELQIADKLVGHTYNRASAMSGHIKGLQGKGLNAYPLPLFTHCYAHVLDLVL
jgi:hypothetical protein